VNYNEFAVFILSHGRPNTCYTYNTLIDCGYTGKIYLLIDNEDKTINEYRQNYGDKVIVFDKKAISENIDVMCNFEGRKAIVYARNANFEIAKQLGLKYFLQLDDDYTVFQYRFDEELKYTRKKIKNLDTIFQIYLKFLTHTKVKSIAMCQDGDLIGGGSNQDIKETITLKRKCMNTWFLNTDKPIKFIGKMNEDYTSSIYYGSVGDIFFTAYNTSISQIATQKALGGMTDIYNNNGTYVKSFFTVMAMPSCTKVGILNTEHKRIHHKTKWNNAVPKIINEKYKKV